tara:strand:+ start:1391 stop:2959 length:1569 start_codon:yes stop_codon:yes gene_type:complete
MFNDDFSKNVSQTVDAYRGNEAKLQKEYKINNDLAKLIAYQQLTTEANDLANAAKLREAKQPNSIKQQYEDKLVQDKTNSLMNRVDQVAGIPQNLQRPRPQGQNQLPQGIAAAQRPPMAQGQRPPMAQGQRPPMPSMGMAQGGIASYNYGGPVQKFFVGSDKPVEATTDIDALARAASRYGSDINYNSDLTTTTTTTGADYAKILKDITGADLTDLNKTPPRTGSKNVVAETLSASDPELMKRLREQANIDPAQAKKDEATRLAGRYMPDKEEDNPLKVLQQQIEEQKKQRADIRDPDRVKKEDNQTYIDAMALGGPRGYIRAMNKLQENRSEKEKEAMANVSKLQVARTSKRQELLEKVDAGAAEEFKTYFDMQTAAAKELANMSADGLKYEQAEYKMMLDNANDKLKNALSAANGIVASQMKVIQQESLSLDKIRGAYSAVADAKNDIVKNLMSMQELQRLQIDTAFKAYSENKENKKAAKAAKEAEILKAKLDRQIVSATKRADMFLDLYMTKMQEAIR